MTYKNELYHLRNENNIKKIVFDARDDINYKLSDIIINNCESFERPDIVSIVDNTAYAIEHFEYDWYKNNKKGSSYQIEEAMVSEKLQKEVLHKEIAYSSRIVESEGTIDYMITNFLKVYRKHCANVEQYKYRVKEKYGTGNIKVWFVAEFTGGIEALTETSEGIRITHPLIFKEVADQLKNDGKIDGIVFVDHKYAEGISRKMFQEQPFRNKENVRVISANPHAVSACIKIQDPDKCQH